MNRYFTPCLKASAVALLSLVLGSQMPAAQATEAVATPVPSAATQRFDAEVDAFLSAYWAMFPESAVGAGRYAEAARLPAPTESLRLQQLSFAEKWLPRLARLSKQTGLTPSQAGDLLLLDNYLQSLRWNLTVLRSDRWDASEYNVADPFSQLLNKTEFAPLPQRLKLIDQRLRQVPAYYRAALAKLHQPSPLHLKLAIAQNSGALSLFREDIPKAIQAAGLAPAEAAAIELNNAKALQALEGFIAGLQKIDQTQAQTGAGRSFRLGQALFEQKFAYEIQASVDAQTLYRRALAEKESLLQRMNAYSDELWPQLFGGDPQPTDRFDKIARVIAKLSERHSAPERFVEDIKAQIPALEKWVVEHDLLTLDPSRPLVVRETPSYMRGVAGASISSPGPLDPKGVTYYNVDPLDKYTPEQAESFLREYNHWVLQVLNIHEAIPGHYVQLLYSNKSPSKIKALFGNGAMVEGWAVYAERMMMESGWGAVDGKPSPEMGLMYAKWNLRVVTNAILDYSVHVLGMTEAEALNLLIREAFQSDTEASEKWQRAQLSSTQLSSYFAGFSEILALREQLKAKQGSKFKLKAFHEGFLSHGSAPVRMVQRLMLDRAPD